jgi:hypothetical protein
MNQIIGPKLSKSDTFYESLLTALPSENGCVGQGLSDPSVQECNAGVPPALESQATPEIAGGTPALHVRASEFALNSCPASARHLSG